MRTTSGKSCGVFAITCALACVAFGETVSLTAENAEVVVDRRAPQLTAFAGREMTNLLSHILGAPIPLVSEPTRGRLSLVLGTNVWSAAEGVNLSSAPRDSFETIVRGGSEPRIFRVSCAELRITMASPRMPNCRPA